MAPGISEDPESPFYLNQMDLWVNGMTHPAPLSREAVEAVRVSAQTLSVVGYDGPDVPATKVVEDGLEGRRFIPAIPDPISGVGSQPPKRKVTLADEMYLR